MTITETNTLGDAQLNSLHHLWNSEYPIRLVHNSTGEFEAYLSELKNKAHLLLLEGGQEISGWCFSFERENDCWFAILLDRKAQGKGYGTLLLNALKKKHLKLSGWVIDHAQDTRQDGSPYRSPLPFYLANGFAVEPAARLETEKISAVKIVWRKDL